MGTYGPEQNSVFSKTPKKITPNFTNPHRLPLRHPWQYFPFFSQSVSSSSQATPVSVPDQ
jgi:hypothetical protein